MVVVIKYLIFIFLSLHLYIKLLNITLSKRVHFCILFLLLIILPPVYLARKYMAPFSIFFIVLLLTFFVNKVLKSPLTLSLTVSSISFAIIYFTFFIAALLVSPIGCSFDIFLDRTTSDIISMLFIGTIQFLLITIPFKFRRLKNGMTFLQEKGSSDIGAYISHSILLTASFFSIREKSTPILIIPLFFTLLCGLLILFWWKSSLTKRYLNKLKDSELEEMKKIIYERNVQIEELKYHNNELSKIIHKDNKLISSMEYAVRKYLLFVENSSCTNKLLLRGQEILIQLESDSQERKGILKDYESKNKKLPSTNIFSIDTLLSYMLQKAKDNHTNLDVSLLGDIKYLIDNMIVESDLRTLLADLIDNAVIASRVSLTKNILITMGQSDDYYSINVFDSGEPFQEEILLNLGVKPTTTHANEGGSGIGLMTTFEIIRKSHASFIIEELINNNLFTKKVSICFDKLNQIRIRTTRSDIKKSLSKRVDIIIIPDNKMDKNLDFNNSQFLSPVKPQRNKVF